MKNNKNPTYIYLDTNVYLTVFNNEVEKVIHSKYLLEEAQKGKYKILASALVIVELYKTLNEPSIQEKARIWTWEFVEVVEVDFKIALLSVEIARECRNPDPPDVIHLATAIEYKKFSTVEAFYTLDEKLINKCKEPVEQKYSLLIIKPEAPLNLFTYK